ncbi:MAG: haloacid dehalogenase [Bacteroidetes bacterium]|nr:MAG: haloacid dehalogenase [Bacteroidota bacterium]
MTLKKKSLIVFDIDGTLTDSVKEHQKAFREALFDIGISEINSEFNSFKHHTDSFIVKEIYEHNQKSTFSTEMKKHFESCFFKRIKVIPFNEIRGAKKLIEKLQKETGLAICYATGSLRKPAEHKLKSIGIEFKEWQLVASDKIYERENIIKQAIKNSSENYKVDKFEKVISVGDGLWDLKAAENLKLEFIGVGATNRELLLQKGAKRVLKDLTEFKV